MNNQRRCGRMCKNHRTLTEYRYIWPYGTLWYIECSSNRIGQDVWTQHISPTTIRAQTNLQTYLKDGLSQVSIQLGYCLFWMMHTTLSITQLYESPIRTNKTPYCQETTQPIGVPSYTTTEMCVPWQTILAIYFSWDYARSLVLSDLPDIPRLISLHYVPTPLLFPFNNCTWKLSFRHTA